MVLARPCSLIGSKWQFIRLPPCRHFGHVMHGWNSNRVGIPQSQCRSMILNISQKIKNQRQNADVFLCIKSLPSLNKDPLLLFSEKIYIQTLYNNTTSLKFCLMILLAVLYLISRPLLICDAAEYVTTSCRRAPSLPAATVIRGRRRRSPTTVTSTTSTEPCRQKLTL